MASHAASCPDCGALMCRRYDLDPPVCVNCKPVKTLSETVAEREAAAYAAGFSAGIEAAAKYMEEHDRAYPSFEAGIRALRSR